MSCVPAAPRTRCLQGSLPLPSVRRPLSRQLRCAGPAELPPLGPCCAHGGGTRRPHPPVGSRLHRLAGRTRVSVFTDSEHSRWPGGDQSGSGPSTEPGCHHVLRRQREDPAAMRAVYTDSWRIEDMTWEQAWLGRSRPAARGACRIWLLAPAAQAACALGCQHCLCSAAAAAPCWQRNAACLPASLPTSPQNTWDDIVGGCCSVGLCLLAGGRPFAQCCALPRLPATAPVSSLLVSGLLAGSCSPPPWLASSDAASAVAKHCRSTAWPVAAPSSWLPPESPAWTRSGSGGRALYQGCCGPAP